MIGYSPGYKHGGKNTRLYSIWHAMKSRCYCKKTKTYKSYGGKGVKVCDEWNNDFSAFDRHPAVAGQFYPADVREL